MFQPPQPRHTFQKIHRRLRQTGSYKTENPVEEDTVRLLLGDMNVPEEVLRAYGVYWDEYKREVVEAFLLAEAAPKDLHDIFRIDEDVIEIYQKVYFDTSVFSDRLDAESYARSYGDADSFGRELKISAIEDGLEYLKARFGRGHYDVSPVKAIRENISNSYINAKVATKVPIDSPKAKEARKWSNSLVKNVEALPDAQNIEGNNTSDYIIQLDLLKEESEKEDNEPNDTPDIDPENLINRRTEKEDEHE